MIIHIVADKYGNPLLYTASRTRKGAQNKAIQGSGILDWTGFVELGHKVIILHESNK